MVISQISGALHFCGIPQNVTLDWDKTDVSFHVTSLYTSVPIKGSLDALNSILISDADLEHRWPVNPNDFIIGIELCPASTFFTFNHVLYRQTDSVAMYSPVSFIVASLFLH